MSIDICIPLCILGCMSSKAEDNRIDDIRDRRTEWLGELGLDESDVFIDDEGREYILSLREDGNPGDDYSVRSKMVYIPDEYRVDYA